MPARWRSGRLEESQRPLFFCFLLEPPDVSSLPVSLFLSRFSRAFQGFPCLEKMGTICYMVLNVAVICCTFSASVRGFVFNVPLKPFNGNHFINNLTIRFFSTADRRMTSQLKWDTRPRGWESEDSLLWPCHPRVRYVRAWQI